MYRICIGIILRLIVRIWTDLCRNMLIPEQQQKENADFLLEITNGDFTVNVFEESCKLLQENELSLN